MDIAHQRAAQCSDRAVTAQALVWLGLVRTWLTQRRPAAPRPGPVGRHGTSRVPCRDSLLDFDLDPADDARHEVVDERTDRTTDETHDPVHDRQGNQRTDATEESDRRLDERAREHRTKY